MSVVIIDYGSGNLRSAVKAFEHAATAAGLDLTVEVTARADDVDRASHVVLPGSAPLPTASRAWKPFPAWSMPWKGRWSGRPGRFSASA